MNLRRFAWPAGITALMVAGALVPASPLRDPVRGVPIAGAHLVRPVLYSVLAPLSDTLDAMSLLSVPQLIAFGVSLILLYAIWRVVRWRLRGTKGWCELVVGLRALLSLVLLVLFAAVLPRPMAKLAMDDPDAVVFDIHSHTNQSHDARSNFTVEDNRAWHRAAGFDVAYITDHRCFDGAAEGMRGNPKRAGDGTVLLSGIELPPEQKHLIMLAAPTVRMPPNALEAWCVRAGKETEPAREAVLIETIPEPLGWMSEIPPTQHMGLLGIEISDGAPRGIAQAHRDHALILQLAGYLGLTPLAGSNNHGWGRTAVAWNVMGIRGWRDLPPDSVGALIEVRLRSERAHAAAVVERRSPVVTGPASLAATLPGMLANLARTISLAERISWIVWAWLVWWAVAVWRRKE